MALADDQGPARQLQVLAAAAQVMEEVAFLGSQANRLPFPSGADVCALTSRLGESGVVGLYVFRGEAVRERAKDFDSPTVVRHYFMVPGVTG